MFNARVSDNCEGWMLDLIVLTVLGPRCLELPQVRLSGRSLYT
jgi:hypothetical protein